MQAQSRFSVAGGSLTVDEHEAVVRELTRGHELTAQLRAEAMRALQGQGQQAEDAAAAAILQEVSRAFAVCLSIMTSPAHAPGAAARRPRDENRR
jgi:indole-3-glycerol phosphate synthase